MHLADFEYYLCSATLVCAMLGMGTGLSVSDFGKVARSPKAIALVFVLQLLISPFVAVLLARLFRVPAGVAFGMLLVAALPGGLFSNLMTYLGRGNVALSVAATSVGTLACIVTTAFVLKLFGNEQLPDEFQVPAGRVLMEIGFNAILPLAAGMIIHRAAPAHSGRVRSLCMRGSFALLAVYVLAFCASGRFDLAEYGVRTLAALVAMGIVMMWICQGVSVAARFSTEDTFTIVLEVLFRNSYIGVLLKASLVPANASADSRFGEGVLFAVLAYGAIALVLASTEIIGKSKGWGVYAITRRGDAVA